ncbi:serine/arginine repetitive matrix protein 3-like [Odocoileus virginianus]|uniref:Serine/arginine repetitive matrix protein 3-like n=1 Tax=Odocoileus virginianus TaxID=9874 RepID=A0ABM4HG59_ODOVR
MKAARQRAAGSARAPAPEGRRRDQGSARPPARAPRRRRRTASTNPRALTAGSSVMAAAAARAGTPGGCVGGRVRHSQSPPPASFEPAPKTSEGVGKRGRSGRERQTKKKKKAPPPGTRAPRPLLSGSGVGAPGERFLPPAYGVQRARARCPPARPFRPALPLRSPLPGARVLRGFSAPLPLTASATAVLQAQPPSSAAPPPCSRPRARTRARPSLTPAPPPRARPSRRPRPRPRAPHSLWTRRERARLASPRSGTRGREKAGGAGARDAGAALTVRASSAGTSRVAPVVWAGAVSVSSGSIPEFPLRRPICLWRGLAFPAPELSTRTTLFFEDDEMIRNPESGECSYLTLVPMKSPHRTQECLRKRTVEVAFLVNEAVS